MRELEGRPYSEIAELLGITTSALETLLFRARRSLAEELENLVTCQNAELAISKQLDGRLSRKDRRRLDEHVAECAACARLAATAKRQRKAFKGLAVLPLPIGLALFKGAPVGERCDRHDARRADGKRRHGRRRDRRRGRRRGGGAARRLGAGAARSRVER